jgi:type VI secretion system protein ImpF
VRAVVDPEQASPNAIRFDIEGELWGSPLPQRLYLRTSLDLEDGSIQVAEASAPTAA